MNDLFLRACRNEPVDRTPVWYMRQAGRHMPEYRALRERHSVLDMCRAPDLAVRVTLLPVEKLGVDAAILFSDITVPLLAVGVGVRIEEGVGPRIDRPFQGDADLGRLRPLEPSEDVPYVLEAVRMLVSTLDVPLIAFSGGPFTLATYLIEGGPSRAHTRTKALMYREPAAWRSLMDRLSDSALAYLRAQVEAGARAVQLFDSWVGVLAPEDYQENVLPATRRIFQGLAPLGVPLIHFGVATGDLLPLMRDAGADVVGLDWRVPIDRGRARLGEHVAVQGNLDPAALLAPWEVVERKASVVLERAGGRPGHVFNLGHGVLPTTPDGVLARLTALVHGRSSARQGIPS